MAENTGKIDNTSKFEAIEEFSMENKEQKKRRSKEQTR